MPYYCPFGYFYKETEWTNVFFPYEIHTEKPIGTRNWIWHSREIAESFWGTTVLTEDLKEFGEIRNLNFLKQKENQANSLSNISVKIKNMFLKYLILYLHCK